VPSTRGCARGGSRACVEIAVGRRGDAAREPGDSARDGAIARRPVAELATAVASPALHAPCLRERASVEPARGDLTHLARKARDVDGGRAIGFRPIAELTVLVGPPALDSACARERAGVIVACGDRLDAARQTGDVHGGRAVVRGSVAQLAVVVQAPALDPARGRERARVSKARGDRGNAAREAGDVDRGGACGRPAATELARAVVTPALGPA